MNDKEKKLISSLRKNGREKIKKIAEDNNIPVSTMFDLLHRLEDKGFIEHKTHINFEKIGYPIKQFFAVKSTPSTRDKLKNFLETKSNINNLHIINSGFDFHFEALFKNQKEAQEFQELLEEQSLVTEKNVYNVIDTLAKEKFMTEEEHFD